MRNQKPSLKSWTRSTGFHEGRNPKLKALGAACQYHLEGAAIKVRRNEEASFFGGTYFELKRQRNFSHMTEQMDIIFLAIRIVTNVSTFHVLPWITVFRNDPGVATVTTPLFLCNADTLVLNVHHLCTISSPYRRLSQFLLPSCSDLEPVIYFHAGLSNSIRLKVLVTPHYQRPRDFSYPPRQPFLISPTLTRQRKTNYGTWNNGTKNGTETVKSKNGNAVRVYDLGKGNKQIKNK